MTSAVCHSYPAQRRLPLLTAGELTNQYNEIIKTFFRCVRRRTSGCSLHGMQG